MTCLSSLVSAVDAPTNSLVHQDMLATLQARRIPLDDYLVTTHRGNNHLLDVNAQNNDTMTSQTLKSIQVTAEAALRARLRGEDLTFVT